MTQPTPLVCRHRRHLCEISHPAGLPTQDETIGTDVPVTLLGAWAQEHRAGRPPRVTARSDTGEPCARFAEHVAATARRRINAA